MRRRELRCRRRLEERIFIVRSPTRSLPNWNAALCLGFSLGPASRQLCPLGLPVNGLTRRSYSGINILLLWSALEERGFASPYWVTFKQCIAMGGSVRKGEKGTHVYFADKFVPQKEKARAEEDGRRDPISIAFLKALHGVQCRAMRWLAQGVDCGTCCQVRSGRSCRKPRL